MKYSKRFKEDFNWYLENRNNFNFDGSLEKYDIPYSKDGVNGMKAFLMFDSQGLIVPTKHPNILRSLIKIKGSINLHIKMYAEDRAKGILPKIIFDDLCQEYNTPSWFINAVENQKKKYY